ncbi:uncharacterized protein LOC118769487 [Megalops cyprinoides]|uniref:uncharacterized protein LOC118769487 n=1 Tax=Megalops cyprinoides TaxID=118141 RepID=UPI001864FE25|nr:uncharacterized protein LOC118769487 [Megalops cyprinoides]
MRKDPSDTCALLNGHSECEDDCEGDTLLAAERTHGRSVDRSWKRKPCPPCGWLCLYSLVVLLSILQVLSLVFYVGTNWRVEELQLQLTALHERAESNEFEPKGAENIAKDKHVYVAKTENEQKLLTMESNLARVNQYVVSLKSSYEKLKSAVEQGETQAQLSSLSNIVLHINETTSNDFLSVRAETSHLKCAIANLTRTTSVMEENISSNMERLDRAFAHIQKLNAEMGLVHGYPNTADLKTTHVPLARPRPQENNSSTNILLMKMNSPPPTMDKHSNNSMEATVSRNSSVERQATIPGQDAVREPDRNDENLQPTAGSTETAGFTEAGRN